MNHILASFHKLISVKFPNITKAESSLKSKCYQECKMTGDMTLPIHSKQFSPELPDSELNSSPDSFAPCLIGGLFLVIRNP